MSQMQKKVIIIVNLWKDFLLRKYFVHVQFKQFLFFILIVISSMLVDAINY